MKTLTQARLKELLHYNPETGVFTWRQSGKGRRFRNALAAGCSSAAGGQRRYWRIRVDGKLYHAHRLAWLYVRGEWPAEYTDHKDADTNGILNLRSCTPRQNAANARLRIDNSSGFKGVVARKDCKRWVAQIADGAGGCRYLGIFDDPAKAAEAYDRAAVAEHGDFARTNRLLGLLP